MLMTMLTKQFPIGLVGFALLLSTAGCRDTIPCPDCDEQAEDEQEDGPLPDLPCGGADLMTDNLNCGSCGHECTLWYPGTEWEAGSCQAGECGPGMTPCIQEGNGFATCAEACPAYGLGCVANGCSGFTALLIPIGFDDGCGFHIDPYQTMASACDEPIPWLHFPEEDFNTYAMCCCGAG